MAMYLMFGKRTDKAVDLIKQLGGEVQAMYATLGQHDLVLVVSLPGTDAAMKASVALTKLTGIGFNTMPAVSVEDFDKLMGEI